MSTAFSVLPVRLEQARALAVPLVRLVTWTPIVSAPVLLMLIAEIAPPGPESVETAARLFILALAGAAGVALEDPAASTTASVPAGLPFRRVVRIVVVGAAVALAWATIAWRLSPFAELPVTGLTLELAALTAFGLAVTAAALRSSPDGRVGIAAAPAVVLFSLSARFLPENWALYVHPSESAWESSRARWAVLLALSLTALAALSADPARRWRGRRARGRGDVGETVPEDSIG